MGFEKDTKTELVKVKMLKNLLLDLKRFSLKNDNWAILVEGKRDKFALEKFSIQNIVELKGRNYHDVAEELSAMYEGVVLLMDFDPEGETIFQKLSKLLSGYGLKTDTSFRERLRETGVKFVEKIPFFLLKSSRC